ncbi:hypothetical protein L2095_23490 [Bacillus zanthoxyli]|nr:hypothetical protein [Bacillus zanthoxyli]
MYTEHPEIPKINSEQVIWRYMDFTKFVDLLTTQSLFFNRSDRFNDPFEGSITQSVLKDRQLMLKYNSFPDKHVENALQQWSAGTEKIRESILINCWHMNDYESAAMWNLYLKSNEGVAIKSNYDRFKNSFNQTDKDIFIGAVKYLDYERDRIPTNNLFHQFLHKRMSFSHENELRAIVWEWEEQLSPDKPAKPYEFGTNVKIDLEMLIDEVYVAPTAPIWFKQLVQSVIHKYDLNRDVKQSNLDSTPLF